MRLSQQYVCAGETSEKILAAVRENAQITIPELAALLGISTRSVERQLRQLQDLHRLKRIGAAKGGYWQVVDP
nr:winged helix-turn-helix transcriptional regulator [uncultured Rhodoferax sp.]